jgi:hypothetical protein
MGPEPNKHLFTWSKIKLILISRQQHRICSFLPVYCDMTAGTRRDAIAS